MGASNINSLVRERLQKLYAFLDSTNAQDVPGENPAKACTPVVFRTAKINIPSITITPPESDKENAYTLNSANASRK
jgi:hypothetical protein